MQKSTHWVSYICDEAREVKAIGSVPTRGGVTAKRYVVSSVCVCVHVFMTMCICFVHFYLHISVQVCGVCICTVSHAGTS